ELLREESGLGIWVEFFNPRIYKLSKGRPVKIFRKLPKDIKRVDIYRRLVRVKEFRNLLVHSRFPLITTEADIGYLEEMKEIYSILLQLIDWLGETPAITLEQFNEEGRQIRSLLMNR
ncbi:MAG: hypothetical protein ACTHMC_06140, partial [Pseudobacter sp.]|uniref:hypothetical protein n=1 Tax=Pseudobacter sp. TaxID=2045420 RepID=UPI003F7F26B7